MIVGKKSKYFILTGNISQINIFRKYGNFNKHNTKLVTFKGDNHTFSPEKLIHGRNYFEDYKFLPSLIFNIFYRDVDEKYFSHPYSYLNYITKKDYVTLLGESSEETKGFLKDNITNKAKAICQGNVRDLIENLQQNESTLTDLSIFLNFINIINCSILLMKAINKIQDYKLMWSSSNKRENYINSGSVNQNLTSKMACHKCVKNNKSIIILDCGHFTLCIECFNFLDKKCSLCKIEASDYLKTN